MDHVIQFCNFMIRIGNDREVERRPLGLLDVFGPTFVRIGGVDAESNHFHAALFEIRFTARDVTELGGANGSEILWVREENCPAIANPFVEANWAFSCICCEIGCYIAKS